MSAFLLNSKRRILSSVERALFWLFGQSHDTRVVFKDHTGKVHKFRYNRWRMLFKRGLKR